MHAHGVPGAGGSRRTKEHYGRLSEGLRVYRRCTEAKLAVTTSRGMAADEVRASEAWLEARGVKQQDIITVRDAPNTLAEVAGAMEALEKFTPNVLHVVTSSYHLPRALACFKALYPHLRVEGHAVGMGAPPGLERLKAVRDVLLAFAVRIEPRLLRALHPKTL